MSQLSLSKKLVGNLLDNLANIAGLRKSKLLKEAVAPQSPDLTPHHPTPPLAPSDQREISASFD
jgi:hypothetical protein